MSVRKDCPLIPVVKIVSGHCSLLSCGKKLTPRRRKWCSSKCSRTVWNDKNHIWNYARRAAKRRDGYKCVTCGSKIKLEVNHVNPLVGSGYGNSCAHHLSNLVTLCHKCHVIETNKQRASRRQDAKKENNFSSSTTIATS